MRIFLKGDLDIEQIIGSAASGRRQRLFVEFQKNFGENFEPVLQVERGTNVRLLLQHINAQPLPTSLQVRKLTGPYYEAQFQTQLFDSQLDVVLLSIEPDLCTPLWRHKTEGFFFAPELDWEQQWPESSRDWLRAAFEPVGLTMPEQFQEDLAILAREIKSRSGAAVIVMNASTIDPEDDTFSFHGRPDSLAMRINRFNLALLRVSMQEGISIIDVDRLAAEAGGTHVENVLRYSSAMYDAIGQELVRIISDLGLVEEDHPVYRVDMPYVDLAVKEGQITAWHKEVGESVAVGDNLVDLETEYTTLPRTVNATLLINRNFKKKRSGERIRLLIRIISADNGNLQHIYAGPGSTVQEGTLLAAITTNETSKNGRLDQEIITAPKFRVSAQKLNLGINE